MYNGLEYFYLQAQTLPVYYFYLKSTGIWKSKNIWVIIRIIWVDYMLSLSLTYYPTLIPMTKRPYILNQSLALS